MITVADLVADVYLQVYQSAPSDDAELDDRQVKFWLTNCLNQVVATELNEKLKRGELFPPIYKVRETCRTISVDTFTGADGVTGNRYYITLAKDVLVINKDSGIVRLIDDQNNIVLRAGVETIDILRYMPYAKPNANQLVYYRSGRNIYIEGLTSADQELITFHVDYIPRQDLTTALDTDEVLISDLSAQSVVEMVVELAKMELYGTTADKENDGVDYKQTNYHTAIANPNDKDNGG